MISLTIKINLKHPFKNPYDPEEIRMDAIINTPKGEFLTLPCFYKTGTSKNSKWKPDLSPCNQVPTRTIFKRSAIGILNIQSHIH